MRNPNTILIEITDLPEGGVKVVASPNVGQLIDLGARNGGLTSAQAYAVSALRHIHNESKRMERRGEKPRIILPPGART